MTRRAMPIVGARTTTVTAAIHRPTTASGRCALVVPGAGGDLDTDAVVALAEVLASLGVTVVRANLPFAELGRRAPRAEASLADAVAVVHGAMAEVANDGLQAGGWVLAGRSYGGRVLSMVWADDRRIAGRVAGLLFSGYPLHPPGRPDRCRVDHWPRLTADCLFVQGERDPFGSPDELGEHTPQLGGSATVCTVRGGDHSLRVTRAASVDGRAVPPAASMHACRDDVARWLAALGR
ncbi:MAG: alpha/beta family hydrolase [Nitriliruptoraceae bacterium]